MTGDRYDVIVIGVGGMGSAACFHLAHRGARVLGLERFNLGHGRGSSHGELRMIRRAYFEHPDYVPLLNRAYELWRELEAESGQSLLVQTGLVVYGDPATSAVYQGTVRSAALHGIAIEESGAAEAARRFPLYRPGEGMGAVYEPGAGFLYCEAAVREHACQAERAGAVIRERECVIRYLFERDGVCVETDRENYSASKLVITGGGWSPGLLESLGLPLELHRLNQYWFEAEPEHSLGRGVPCFAFHEGGTFYYGFPSIDMRTIKIGSHFSRARIGDPFEKDITEPPAAELDAVRDFIRLHLPRVSSRLDRFSSCIYTMTPDENFIVDVHPRNPACVFAAGFSGHGFKFSSVMGEVLADLALEGTTRHAIEFLGTPPPRLQKSKK